jgi:hypothetical protein
MGEVFRVGASRRVADSVGLRSCNLACTPEKSGCRGQPLSLAWSSMEMYRHACLTSLRLIKAWSVADS